MKPYLRIVRHLNALVAGGVGGVYLYNQTYGLDKSKTILEVKVNNEPMKLPPKINSLITEVMDDMNLNEEQRSRIKPFLSKTIGLVHLGWLDSASGAFLGVPFSFSLEENDSPNFKTSINHVLIPKDAPEIKVLNQSLCLSKEAKKFGIAHELYSLINSVIPVYAILPFVMALQFNIITFAFENFPKESVRNHVMHNVVLYLFLVLIYFVLLDIISVHNDIKSDFLASDLGESYAKGGIEYYEKILKTNKEIKKFNENSPFTKEGEIKTFLRTPYMPFQKKLLYLNDTITEKGRKSLWYYIVFRQ